MDYNENSKCRTVTGITDKPITDKSMILIEETLNKLYLLQREQGIKIINLLEVSNKPVRYNNYYDNSSTITTATVTKPADSDSSGYTSINLWQLLERNSPRLTIYNDGPGTLYIIISHISNQFSNEFPLYEGEAKTYLDVREIKLRSPIAGCAYRLTEYELWKQKNIDYKAGRGYIRNQTLAVGNVLPATAYTTADTHTINATINRNSTTGYIKNRDTIATLFVWVSVDGTEYGQSGSGLAVEYFTVEPNSAVNLDGWEIFSLVIGANQNNVDYEVVVG